MTVTERPLLGKVEIERLSDVWEPARRNLIRSPRFIAGWVNTRSTATINNGTVTITPTEVGFFPRFEISPSHRFTVTPGTPWAVGVEIVGSPTVTHRLGVQFIDGTGGGVGPAINATGNTGRLTLDGTVPAGAAEVHVRLGLPDFAPIDQTAAFKEPIWENTPTVGPFFDGAGGSARGYATAWEGAPDASASYLYDANQRVRWAGSADNSVSILDNSRVDFLATANAASITRGGSRIALGVKTDVGLMTFTLIDDEDPLSGGTFRPGQEVRAISLDTGQPLFTGTVVDVDAAYPLNKTDGTMRTRTTVTVADAVHQHVSTPRYGAMIGPPYYETFEQRIDRLAASALAPVVVPVEGAPIVRYAL